MRRGLQCWKTMSSIYRSCWTRQEKGHTKSGNVLIRLTHEPGPAFELWKWTWNRFLPLCPYHCSTTTLSITNQCKLYPTCSSITNLFCQKIWWTANKMMNSKFNHCNNYTLKKIIINSIRLKKYNFIYFMLHRFFVIFDLSHLSYRLDLISWSVNFDSNTDPLMEKRLVLRRWSCLETWRSQLNWELWKRASAQ